MKDNSIHTDNLSGSLLVAHPELLDPNFNKSVILLSSHTDDNGAFGVVINRPMGKTLGEVDEKFSTSPLSDVEIYLGGPVSPDEMILSAWNCQKDTGVFKLYFGITEEKAKMLMEEDPNTVVRGFLGYSGWSEGQLEGEIKQKSWIVTPVDKNLINSKDGNSLWRLLVNSSNPDLGYLADVPEDPSLN